MPIGAFKLNTISRLLSTSGTITATGGSVNFAYISGVGYKIHTFTTTGSNSFVVSATTGTPKVDILLVGGGGAGGGVTTTTGAGGGGAGGAVVYQTGVPVIVGTGTVTVGAGGSGANAADGNPGGSSSTTLNGGITAAGGGGGTVNSAATNGGGSGSNSVTSFTSTQGTYAYKGGNSFGSSTAGSIASGGAAGAGGAGTNAANATGGNGGIGIQNNINGFNLYYGSGGGGSGTTAGQVYDNTGTLVTSVGSNGGGRSVTNPGRSNLLVYGGGGGGAYNNSSSAEVGGSGNQGIAILRYPAPLVSQLTYISSTTTSNSSTVTWPTVQAGDIAIYFNSAVSTFSNAVPTTVNPTGFNSIQIATNNTTRGLRSNVFYKVCTGNESGTTLTGMTYQTSTTLTTNNLIIYRPNIPNNQIIVSTGISQAGYGSSGVITNQVLPMGSINNTTFVGFAYYFAGSGGSVTRGSTVTATREIANNATQYVQTFDALTPSSTIANSTFSISTSAASAQSLISFYITII